MSYFCIFSGLFPMDSLQAIVGNAGPPARSLRHHRGVAPPSSAMGHIMSKPTYLSWIWMDLVFLVAHRFCTFKPLKRFKYSLKITFSFESWKVLVAHVCADAFVCCRSFFDVCLCAGASLIEIHEMLSPFGLLRQCFCLAMLSAKSGGSRFPLASFCKPVVAQRTGIAEARRPLETRQEKEMGREVSREWNSRERDVKRSCGATTKHCWPRVSQTPHRAWQRCAPSVPAHGLTKACGVSLPKGTKKTTYSVYRKTSSYPKLPPLDFCGLQLLFNYL